MRPSLSILLFLICLSGCSSNGHHQATGPAGTEFGYLAKTDIDTVTDIHIRRVEGLLKRLATKLYRRNPRHCEGGTPAIKACVARLFEPQHNYPGLQGKRRTESIRLAFDEHYEGDRVLALVIGLKTMIAAAYGNKQEFFMIDDLDPQKLYNSARNIEITVWRLSQYRQANGELFLISNELDGKIKNLSFERLFGELISLQDTMALIIAEKSRRTIKNVIQRLASAVFLPI
ncbi:hypothetical protein [Sulfuriflexus sp.]|uniref:hypothetical protein n=1 Tax=Sulfuriflexus sp. TaxID=2015443 RepID=UPI0028CEEE08|nr:hypothetical protein [Sulfuriflexus sp.]MDT8405117.1 hypothetical protein [Sulfuriflexus sp.]